MDQKICQRRNQKEVKLSQSLFIIKPDAVSRNLVGQIIMRFEQKGFKIIKLKMFQFTKQQAEEFYTVHKDRPFFGDLISFITSGLVVAAVIEGNEAIETTRIMIGKTKSSEAAPGSIRGDFGLGFTDNIIHASDSPQSFQHEERVAFQ